MNLQSIKKVLFLGIVAVLLVTFSACDLALGGIPTEDIATRGTVGVVEKGKTPQAFTAIVNLYQDLTSVVTRSMGNSDHYKTVEETLYSQQYGPFGGAIVSDWDLLDGKNVVMTNVTNYNLDPLSLEIAGSNHSLIHVVDEQGAVVLTLQANGVLDGSLFGATIDMNWVVKDSYGADVKARGKIDGTFTWAIFDPTSMSVEFVLPHGTFNLTGTYH